MYFFIEPLVTSSAPLNFGQTGGSVVTLFGVNFAPNDYSTKARLGKTGCVSTQWTSESSIECGVPAGTTAVSMSLTVFKKTGTSFLVFSYNQPEITHVTLRNVPTVTSATISMFGSAHGVWDTGAVVGYIGVSTCESTTWRSDSTIQGLLRHGISPGQEVSIGLETTKSIMPAYFTYDATVFTDVGRSNMPPQQQVERGLSGSNYGSASYSPRAAVGRSGCAASMWTSDTSLACATSTGAYSGLALLITIQRAVSGTRSLALSYDAPAVAATAANANQPAVGGTSTTRFEGSAFGIVGYSAGGRVGATATLSSRWLSDTSLSARAAAGMALDLAVQVSVASVANLGTITGSVSYDAPSISSRAPSNAAFRGGNVVALAVVNAGAADYTIQARIGVSFTQAFTFDDHQERVMAARDDIARPL